MVSERGDTADRMGAVGVVVVVVVEVVLKHKENLMATKKAQKTRKIGFAALIGRAVIVRAVTHYYTGRLVAVEPQEITLEDAAWIADTGRWSEALRKGIEVLSEVEPYPDGIVIIGRGAIVDVSEWRHPLPRETK